MINQEQNPQNSDYNLQTLVNEVALTKQEINEFQKLPKEERRKHRDEKLKKLGDLKVKLDQMIQEAIRTGDLGEAKKLNEQIEKELSELEVLLSPNREKLIELPFDPNKIFTTKDWEDLQNEASKSIDRHDIIFCRASLAIIDRNKLLSPDDFSKELLSRPFDKDDTMAMAWWLYAFPESERPPDTILKKAIKKTEEYMLGCKKGNDWRHFVEPVAWLTVLGHRPELTEEDFKKIEAEFKLQQEKDQFYFIEMAAAISIIYPDYPLEISEEQGKKMADTVKEWVDKRVGGNEWELISAMAKIVADKLREIEANKELD